MFNNLHHKELSSLAVAGTATSVSLVASDEGTARKSHLFLQNKANFKITRNDISTYNTYTYGNLIAFFIPKNKAKQSQFKPNFSSKLALFSRNEPNFKPNSVKIGSLYRLTISKSVFRFYSVFFVPRPLLRQIIGFCFTKISRKMA
jgi:hypothetical protein